MRRKWTWTGLQEQRLKEVQKIISSLKDYWPLTLRQIHYQLYARQVQWGGRRSSPRYPNTKPGYGDLIKVGKYGRIDGLIPWSAIADETRATYRPYKFEDLQEYFKNELRYLLTDYKRCLVQDQSTYVEIWIEKQALFRIFKTVASEYCVPVIACTGYDSVTYLNQFRQNALAAISKGQNVWVLYFGDQDPSGMNMMEASQITLYEEMGLDPDRVVFHRVAVTPELVQQYHLPNDPDAADTKKADKRFPKYVKRYGHLFVELDAFTPQQLEHLIRSSLAEMLDIDALEEQAEIEEKDLDRLEKVRQKIIKVINEEMGTRFSI